MCNNPLKQWEVGTDGQTYDFGYVQSVPQFIEEVYEIAFGEMQSTVTLVWVRS